MELYEHQKKVIEADPKKCLIAWGTGGAKTRTCLELAKGRTLVVCPKQQKLDKTWEENAKKFGIQLKLTVISKEEFRRDSGVLPPFDTVIVDECHTILGVSPETRQRKGIITPKSSQLFENALSYIRRTAPGRLYLASATPVTRPMHLYALGTLLGYKVDFFRFRERYYFERKMGYRSIWIPRNTKELKSKIASYTKQLGFTGKLDDWFEVPPQSSETIFCDLTKEQRDAIREITESEADPMVARAKIRQIENGLLYYLDVVSEDDGKTDVLRRRYKTFRSGKFEILQRYCERYGRVLIFANYRGQIDAIESFLLSEYPERQIWTLTGDTKGRETIIREANASESGIVIAQASISSGYELPGFPCVIFASLSNKVIDHVQGMGRVLRANALKENMYVYLVTKGGADEQCYDTIMSGSDFVEKILSKEG